MRALTSMQGTAMYESVLCDRCHANPALRAMVRRESPADWDGGEFVNVDDNDAGLTCTECGIDVGEERDGKVGSMLPHFSFSESADYDALAYVLRLLRGIAVDVRVKDRKEPHTGIIADARNEMLHLSEGQDIPFDSIEEIMYL